MTTMQHAGLAEVQYMGHGMNTGGLQQHSIGPEYPYITHMVGSKWRILDSRTGNTYWKEFESGQAAHAFAALARLRDVTVITLRIGKDGRFTHRENV